MSKTSNIVFRGLHIVAWLIFIGLSIEAGAIVTNFVFSVFKPEMVGNLYQKLDLSSLHQQNKWAFYGIYSFVISISVLKAFMFYTVVMLMHRIDLSKPFSSYVSEQITKISYYTLTIGFFSHMAHELTKNLLHHGYDVNKLNQFWEDGEAFILMAAIIYVIAIIFKKGIELQDENDLTV